MITEETAIDVVSEQDAELLLVDVKKKSIINTLYAEFSAYGVLHRLQRIGEFTRLHVSTRISQLLQSSTDAHSSVGYTELQL
jgi:hypothetical protein